ncbi:MAG: endonuclease III [archaeon]
MVSKEKQIKAIKQLGLLKLKSSKMRLAAEKWDADWKTLIAISLSAQSRDETTITIATKLFEKYNTLEKLASAKYVEVLFVLKSLNYNKTKAANIIACAKMLREDYSGVVPLDFDKLITLPGVGRKTANVFLSENGFDAIGVDTHAAYISRKLNWTKNKNPKKIEEDLKQLFPKQKWKQINPVLVRFGKTYTSKKNKDKILKEVQKMG